MASRSRRRRYNTDAGDEDILKEQDRFKVKFVEEVDYKMEIEDEVETKPREIKIINEDPS